VLVYQKRCRKEGRHVITLILVIITGSERDGEQYSENDQMLLTQKWRTLLDYRKGCTFLKSSDDNNYKLMDRKIFKKI
jgi:hypothetical protein